MSDEHDLTRADIQTLRTAAHLRRRFDAGIFARDSGQASHLRKLARFGLLSVVGWGRDIDRETAGDEVMIYELTPLAKAVIAQRDAIRVFYKLDASKRLEEVV